MTMISSFREKIRKLRRSERTLVLIRARLLVSGNEIPVDIIDISETGARLYTAADLSMDSSLTLRCEDWTVIGKIVWSDGSYYGMKFDTAVGRSLIQNILSKAQKLAG